MFIFKISLHPTEDCFIIYKQLSTSRLSSSFLPPWNCFSANTAHPPAPHQKRLVCSPARIKGRGNAPAHSVYTRFAHPHSFPGRARGPRPTSHPLSGGRESGQAQPHTPPGKGISSATGSWEASAPAGGSAVGRPLRRSRSGTARGCASGAARGARSARAGPRRLRSRPPGPRDPALRPRPAHPRPGGEPLTMAAARCLCLAGRSRLHAPAFAPTPAARRAPLPSRPRRAGLRGGRGVSRDGAGAGAMAEAPGQAGCLRRTPGPVAVAPVPVRVRRQRPLRAAGL